MRETEKRTRTQMRLTLKEAWPTPNALHVQTAVERLAARFDPLRILVFGSYARGDVRAGSDLDLLVILPQVENKRTAAVAMRRLTSDLPVPHDVFVTTPDEIERRGWIIGSLLREALDDGVVVHERREGEAAS